MTDRRSGGCLCGGVRYTVSVKEPQFSVCHCSMCRKWAAGPYMSVHCRGDDVAWESDETLKWYRSSKWAERGFCDRCGSSLFYRMANRPEMLLIVSVDSFDDADDITLKRHIYVDEQPARYAFADTTPRVTKAELMAEFGMKSDGDG